MYGCDINKTKMMNLFPVKESESTRQGRWCCTAYDVSYEKHLKASNKTTFSSGLRLKTKVLLEGIYKKRRTKSNPACTIRLIQSDVEPILIKAPSERKAQVDLVRVVIVGNRQSAAAHQKKNQQHDILFLTSKSPLALWVYL